LFSLEKEEQEKEYKEIGRKWGKYVTAVKIVNIGGWKEDNRVNIT
jgi:hypothetical protein